MKGLRIAIRSFKNVQFLRTLRSAFFEFTQNSVQSLGSRITSAGSRITSAGSRIISAGSRIISAGRIFISAGGIFISAGRRFISAGRIFMSAGCINTSWTGSFISRTARNTSGSNCYF